MKYSNVLKHMLKWHSRGKGFDPPHLHHKQPASVWMRAVSSSTHLILSLSLTKKLLSSLRSVLFTVRFEGSISDSLEGRFALLYLLFCVNCDYSFVLQRVRYSVGKLIRFSSTTSGRFMMRVFIAMIYSPRKPRKASCTPPMKNTAIMVGA